MAVADGDIGIVPDGAVQVISSGPEESPVPLSRILADGALEAGVLRYGSGDRQVRLLCGFCEFDEGIEHPVLANLPSLMVLRAADLGSEPWVAATLRLLTLEADFGGRARPAFWGGFWKSC